MKTLAKLHTLAFALLLVLSSCDSTPLEEGFEYSEIESAAVVPIELDSKEGSYFIFNSLENSSCTIRLTKQSTDIDLTFGSFEEGIDLDELTVYSASKNPGLDDEEIVFSSLENNTYYLIEVWNYSTLSGSAELTLSLEP